MEKMRGKEGGGVGRRRGGGEKEEGGMTGEHERELEKKERVNEGREREEGRK